METMFNVKRTTNNVQVSFLFGIFVFIGHWKLSIWHCSLKRLQFYYPFILTKNH